MKMMLQMRSRENWYDS